MKNTNGFTLVELMIVMAIIGIVVAIAMPYMRPIISNSQNKAISNQLLIDIMYTRNVAITNQRNAQMIPLDPTLGSGTLAAGGGVNWAAGWRIVDTAFPNDTLRRQENLGPDPQIRSIDVANLLDFANPIEFNPQGYSERRGTLQVAVFGCIGDSARQLQINQVGQVIGAVLQCPAGYAAQ